MEKKTHVIALIMAAGKGSRMGYEKPKQFLCLGGKTIFERTLETVYNSDLVNGIVGVIPSAFNEEAARIAEPYSKKLIGLVEGGLERQDSVKKALDYLKDKAIDGDSLVLIHDGARPYLSETLISRTISAAEREGAATAVVPPKDTIRTKDGSTLPRGDLYAVQTPQVFKASLLFRAYDKAYQEGYYGTDDAGLVERLGQEIALVKGEEKNIKITTPEDVRVEERIGIGFDVHRLEKDRKLVLGGVDIPYERGLKGHSDADVPVHALIDAILGAAGLGDIGRLYPDYDPAYKDISSLLLLEKSWEKVSSLGFELVNCDINIICQEPKLAPYIPAMEKNIGKIMDLEEGKVNIKATTTEKLGFTGREEGIAAEAVCMLSAALK